ncbi:SCO6880 family protein [Aciditerrimonas ferrireducens]|uniref:SCO6880 family protein n=1 Tax=Aciditerrimonas ferrireducens TaxID=667306 RepID=A0ABV6C293_9ACTN
MNSAAWQRERAGVFFGLDGAQSATLAGAAVCLLLVIVLHSWVALGVLAPLGGLLAASALVRIEGRAPVQWSVTALAHAAVRLRGAHRFKAATPWQAIDGDGELVEPEDPGDEWDLPGILAPLRLLEVDDGRGGKVAVVHHRVDQTYTAVARVTHPGLTLVSTAKAQNRVQGWAAWLAQQCVEDGQIVRVGAYHWCEPGETDELAAWTARHVRPDAPPQAVELVREVIAQDRRRVSEHVSYLAVTLSAARSRREIKAAGGGDRGACAVLARRLGPVAGSVLAGGVEVERWLSPRELAGVIREAFAPGAARDLSARRLAALDPGWRGAEPGLPARFAGPTSAETHWGLYRHDDALSVVAEIHWPRTPRDASMLSGLVSSSGRARRQVAIVYEPLPPRVAERTLAMDRTRRDVAIRLRHRTGQIAPMREHKELEVATVQDAELAAGHGLLRFAAYVAVTVTDPEDLEAAWDELCADAASTGLVLRRCSGWVDAAFAAAAVPVGLGLPGRQR